MTELDLIGLGIRWIPIPLPGAGRRAHVNVWAIEDVGGLIALFDCGLDAPESLAALAGGLYEAGSTLDDVHRVVLSHAHPEHAGGARMLGQSPERSVAAFSSGHEAKALRGTLDRVRVLHDGGRFQFRRFGATVLVLPGHTAGLTCLFAEDEGILFSSDHLVHGVIPSITPDDESDAARSIERYRESLSRVAALDVRVVLPGRGEPFAGHRRAVREVLASLDAIHPRARRGAVRVDGSGTSATEA